MFKTWGSKILLFSLFTYVYKPYVCFIKMRLQEFNQDIDRCVKNKLNSINVSTECLIWRLMLRQMRESVLLLTLQVRTTRNTIKILLIGPNNVERYDVSKFHVLSYITSLQMVRLSICQFTFMSMYIIIYVVGEAL